MLAAGLAGATPAAALTAAEIKQRIAAAFALAAESSSDTAEQLILSVMARRSFEQGGAVALLPYRFAGPDERQPDLLAILSDGGSGEDAGAEIVEARMPRPRPEPPLTTGSLAVPDAAPADAAASEVAFFGRFAGSFSGSGQVQRSASERPNQVKCTLTGRRSAHGVSMSGKCGAFIFSREVSAEISYDPATGRYSGVYVGSDIGPARLTGTRRGDAVVLAITWPKPVNGDTQATMTIRNSGDGELVITVTDALHPGGPEAEVTRLALNQA